MSAESTPEPGIPGETRHQHPRTGQGPPPQGPQHAEQGPARHGLDRRGHRGARRHRSRLPVLQAQRQHQERRHQPGPRHRPAHRRSTTAPRTSWSSAPTPAPAANKKLGGGTDDGSARSDTAMIVHVYEGHKKASVVSIPRDTLVDRPACTDAKGDTPRRGLRRDVQLRVLHGRRRLRGEDRRVDHRHPHGPLPRGRLHRLPEAHRRARRRRGHHDQGHQGPRQPPEPEAGTHTLNGEQALGLVRTRHGVGDGSDLGRIQLQQAFIKALVDQVKHVGVLSNPKKLFDLADTATKAVTTDSDLGSVNDLDVLRGRPQGHQLRPT